ncbi:hypothetical protein AWN76_012165 [Rhodothermaceae bacterium RA]|nr:hypothetical protein AWN76_012165 [Rhodothermaceae bacterium RA]
MRASLLFLILALPLLPACQPDSADPAPAVPADAPYDVFGAAITPDDAVPVQSVAAAPADYAGRTVKLEGTVTAVCQMSGCWLTLDAGDGTGVRIVMPRQDGDYVFTVPKDIAGRTVVVQGTLEETTLDAATQAHLARDAGAEADEADFEATPELQITADAVLVQRT